MGQIAALGPGSGTSGTLALVPPTQPYRDRPRRTDTRILPETATAPGLGKEETPGGQ